MWCDRMHPDRTIFQANQVYWEFCLQPIRRASSHHDVDFDIVFHEKDVCDECSRVEVTNLASGCEDLLH